MSKFGCRAANDALAARGELGEHAPMQLDSVAVIAFAPFPGEYDARDADGRVQATGAGEGSAVPPRRVRGERRAILATGFRPDPSFPCGPHRTFGPPPWTTPARAGDGCRG